MFSQTGATAMKTRYAKERRRRKRTVKTRRKARERQMLMQQVQEELHVSLDKEEVGKLLQDSLDQFAIEIGRRVAVQLLEEEVNELCGPRHQWGQEGRSATRYGHQKGYICIGAQKVRIERPRVRSIEEISSELPLARYQQLQRPETLPQAILRRMVRGVSTRDYEGAIDLAQESCGVKKSSVSRGFVRASAESLQAWAMRSLAGVRFVAVFIDGVEYAGETLVVALGLTSTGHKQVLGMRQGATENGQVVTSLLEELQERGLDTSRPTLFVLDGAKALVAGVKRVFGRLAFIQRCQIHKRRNVKAHLHERHHADLDRRLSEAYRETSHGKAHSLLKDAVRWLQRISPDAAASLEEGLDETLTVIRLGIPEILRRTLSNTNVIESALSVTRNVTARVKRWRDGDMRRRWCCAGLQRAEEKFRRVKGYKQIDQLIAALDAAQLDAKGKAG
jgi:transposase-like protein